VAQEVARIVFYVNKADIPIGPMPPALAALTLLCTGKELWLGVAPMRICCPPPNGQSLGGFGPNAAKTHGLFLSFGKNLL
jgi:hypothetical protein